MGDSYIKINALCNHNAMLIYAADTCRNIVWYTHKNFIDVGGITYTYITPKILCQKF